MMVYPSILVTRVEALKSVDGTISFISLLSARHNPSNDLETIILCKTLDNYRHFVGAMISTLVELYYDGSESKSQTRKDEEDVSVV